MGLFDFLKKTENMDRQEVNTTKLAAEDFNNEFPNLSLRKLTVELADTNDVYKMLDTSRFLYQYWDGWPLIHDNKISVFPKEIFFQAVKNKTDFSTKGINFIAKLSVEDGEIWNSSPQEINIDDLKDFLNEFYLILPKLDHANYYFTAYDFQLNWDTTSKILLKDSDFTTGHTYAAAMDDENKNKARFWDDNINKWIYIDIHDRMIFSHHGRNILIRKKYHSDTTISLYRRLQELSSYAKDNNLTLYWEFHQC